MIQELITSVSDGESLTEDQMAEIVDAIMKGQVKDKAIAELLTGLHNKGETVDELAGTAKAMRWNMQGIETWRDNVVDTCGTGGGQTGTFNISTAAAIVAASAGASVAKHGNRKSTSKTGSADVLQKLGVNIECSIPVVQKCLDSLGLCFCFAPLFHPSVKKVTKVRKKLNFPTIFNLVGPLCNPANAPYQVLGVGRGETRELIANALARLGTTRSIVVHGQDGLGEISNSTTTDVSEVRGKMVSNGTLEPSDFDIEASSFELLRVSDASESAEVIQRVLDGHRGPVRDVVVVNAAAAVWVSGLSDNLVTAAERCSNAIENGQAKEMLKDLVEMTNKGK